MLNKQTNLIFSLYTNTVSSFLSGLHISKREGTGWVRKVILYWLQFHNVHVGKSLKSMYTFVSKYNIYL